MPKFSGSRISISLFHFGGGGGRNRYTYMYEGCQKSSWTPIVKASNEPDFDIYYYISFK